MITYLWIAAGGALGSIARFWVTGMIAMLLGPQFPWGTILINIAAVLTVASMLYYLRKALPYTLDSR